MVVFRFELARRMRHITIWAVTLAICIFAMTPLYYQLIAGAMATQSPVFETFGNSDYFRSVGMSVNFLLDPLGIYSFVSGFFAIAAGIFGVNLGVSLYTTEYADKTSEYLYTKPHTRSEIFRAKAGVVFVGAAEVGAGFVLSSLAALCLFMPGFNIQVFFLISGILPLLILVFAIIGVLMGVLFPKNRSPMLTAGLFIFVEYCLASFARVIDCRPLGYFSPFSFFTAASIADIHAYELDYMLCYLVVMIVCTVAAHTVFLRRDL